MQIAGIQKTTLVDYPGKIAATVFLRGCNFRCGFCHNPELVLPERFLPPITGEELFSFLESRLGKLQGVCITGGEPLLWGSTRELISHIKALGFAVKLDTNGSYPERLAEIIKDGDLDYIAMDIKAPLQKYAKVTNSKSLPRRQAGEFVISNQIPNSKLINLNNNPSSHSEQSEESHYHDSGGNNVNKEPNNETMKQANNSPISLTAESSKLEAGILQSIDLIMSSGIDYEFRTTVVKPLHKLEDFQEIGKMIKGADKYYIQNFVKSKHVLSKNEYKPFSDAEINLALDTIRPFVAQAMIR